MCRLDAAFLHRAYCAPEAFHRSHLFEQLLHRLFGLVIGNVANEDGAGGRPGAFLGHLSISCDAPLASKLACFASSFSDSRGLLPSLFA
eukprot:scaffold649_cov347-Pavlova_lutheri.AAC.49